jgi:acetyl esterase/lipase
MTVALQFGRSDAVPRSGRAAALAVIAIGCLLACPMHAAAQAEPVIPLWKGDAPGSEGQTTPEAVDAQGHVSSIHHPSVTVFAAPAEKATGAGVLVCPGGGHRYLAIQHEGYDVARWFNGLGVTAFVLKYRLARDTNSPYKVELQAPEDARRALRVIRSRAAEWRIDPARVGIIGFSAGGEVVMYASARYDTGNATANDPVERENGRPDFQILVYPGPLGSELPVPADAPPAFLTAAYDDNGPAVTVAKQYLKLKEAGVPAELHVYNRGGHGFGLRDRPMPITSWRDRLYEWLIDRGFVPLSGS